MKEKLQIDEHGLVKSVDHGIDPERLKHIEKHLGCRWNDDADFAIELLNEVKRLNLEMDKLKGQK